MQILQAVLSDCFTRMDGMSVWSQSSPQSKVIKQLTILRHKELIWWVVLFAFHQNYLDWEVDHIWHCFQWVCRLLAAITHGRKYEVVILDQSELGHWLIPAGRFSPMLAMICLHMKLVPHWNNRVFNNYFKLNQRAEIFELQKFSKFFFSLL